MKQCRSCKQERPLDSFGKDASQNDGLRIYCRDCSAGQQSYNYFKYKGKKELDQHPWKITHDLMKANQKQTKIANALSLHYWMTLDDVMWRTREDLGKRESVRKLLHVLVSKGKAIKRSKGPSKHGPGFIWEFKLTKPTKLK